VQTQPIFSKEDSMDKDLFNPAHLLRHLGRLSDFIFAIAMGLTIFDFDPAKAKELSNDEVTVFLKAQIEPLTIFAITFLVMAFYWIDHAKRFSYFKKTNDIHLWLYLLYLMSIFVVPYSNAMSFEYPDNTLVKLWFSANIFLIGLFSCLSWVYATYQHCLVEPDLDTSIIRSTTIQSLIEPIVALISIPLTLLNQDLWEWSWLLVPIFYVAAEKIMEKNIRPPTIAIVKKILPMKE
jgi:uncharacterized membrane protein